MPKQYEDPLAACGFQKLATARDRTCLTEFYREIPFRYPSLFEALCLTYSWGEATIGDVELAANPAGLELQGLAASVRYDPHLWAYLAPHGYLIFGRVSGGGYDPCAFDMNRRRGHDAPVVRVDHEQILSFDRLGRPSPLATSFRAFLDASLVRGRRTSG